MNFTSPYKLLWEILRTRWPMRVAILGLSLAAAASGLLGPIFQKDFVDKISQAQTTTEVFGLPLLNTLSPSESLLASFLTLLLALLLSALANFLGTYESTKMQRIWANDLYQKVLKLRSDSLHGKQTGELVSIYATDIPGATILLEQSLPMGAGILFPLLLAPIALMALFPMALGPLLTVLGGLIVINALMAYRQSVFFFRFKKLAADRIALVSEWIQNIRALRILNWMPQFEQKIFSVRKTETKNRVSMVTNGQAMNSIASTATFVLNILCIYWLTGVSDQNMTPGGLLALLWIVAIFLTRPFRAMPWFFTFLFDSWTSLKRLSEVFNLKNSEAQTRPSIPLKVSPLLPEDPSIELSNLNLSIQGELLLKNINFRAQQSELICLVGEVGSGKSLFLLSLMGETGASTEKYYIGKNNTHHMTLEQLRQFFSYVPQEGFVMSATVRENIHFEYSPPNSFDGELLSSMKLSEIHPNYESNSFSLETELGERGVNLSGGQKQRINLARAHFNNAQIILLDDCLSALDVETEKSLIQNLISGDWKDKTRILVTHRLSVLEKADRIIFMKTGQFVAQGTLRELMGRSKEFVEFISTVEEGGGNA